MALTLVSRWTTRIVVALLALDFVAVAFDASAWWQARRLGDRIATVDRQPPRDDDPPALRFARAKHLGERGDTDAAVNLYRTLQSDHDLKTAARYNGSNLLLRRAMTLRESSDSGQAVTLVELAKQGYRDLLRDTPDHWDARYNLERAQRLVPEPEDIDPAIGEPRNDAERAPTTMRGVSRGAP